MTGIEVAERKSVMRFLLTISLSALPGSSREEETTEGVLSQMTNMCVSVAKITLELADNGQSLCNIGTSFQLHNHDVISESKITSNILNV